MINYQNYTLFPSLVSVYDLSQCEDTDKVLEIISKEKNQVADHGLVSQGKSSYYAGYENFFKKHNLDNLSKDIHSCLDMYCQEAGIDQNVIVQSWYNVLENGGNIRRHRHEKSVLTGAYYPKINKGEDCTLFVENPTDVFKFVESPQRETVYTSKQQGLTPFSGMLVIFPSYLYHFTNDNQGEERISISFNTVDRTMLNIIELAKV